jgi:hypothetical protein
MTEALIFFGQSAAGHNTIFKSMGAPANTAPIVDRQLGGTLGGELSFPGRILLGFDKKILAQGTHNGSSVLWIYDGVAGTYTPYTPGGSDFSPIGFVEHNGAVYFNGNVSGQGNYLFFTDGTAEGTNWIAGSNLNPTSLAVAYNKLFFAGDAGSGPVLYSYEGGRAPPAPVGVDVLNPSSLAVAFVGTLNVLPDPDLPFVDPPQPPLFMSGKDSTGTWLFKYDGSNLTKIAPTTAPSGGLTPSNLVNLEWVQTSKVGPLNLESWHRVLCFSGANPSGGRAVWISLGTTETTTQIPMPPGWPGPDLGIYIDPYNLTPFNGRLYFSAYDSPNGQRGLFVYDPVANETTHIIPSFAYFLDAEASTDWGDGALNQYTMAVFNNKLYFNASQGGLDGSTLVFVGKPSLWSIHGAPTTGFATPTLVSAGGGQDGLQPFSLTTANF